MSGYQLRSMAAHLLGQPQQLTPQQIIAHEDFMKLFDRGPLPVDAEKESLKRPLPAAFTQFDPANKRPLPIITQQMQNNMLTHQQLMQHAAIQAAMQARTMPSTAQNSYLTPPHLRPLDAAGQQTLRQLDPSQQMRQLDTTTAQQMRQMDQNAAAAAAAAQQYRAHDSAMAQQLQRQLQPQLLQNQAALQMRNQQMTVQEYHNLLRLTQPPSLQQRRQTIGATNINPQMASAVPRLQRPAVSMAPPQSSLQFSHQMAPPLSTMAPPLSLAAPIPLPQPNLLAQHLMNNAMRAQAPTLAPPPMSAAAPVSQPQPMNSSLSSPPTTSATVSTGGMDDAEFLAFLENVRQIEAHLTRTLAESIQRSTTAQQQTQ